MRSQLADAARRGLADDVKRMTPEQRLAAFWLTANSWRSFTAQAEQSSKALDTWRRETLPSGPVDLADARTVIELDRQSLDLALLRRLSQRFGRDAARAVEDLIGDAD